jgi:hypothetical protein
VYSNIKVGLRPVIRHMLYVVAVLLLTGATLVVLAWLPAPVEPVRIHNALEIARSPDTVFDFTTTPHVAQVAPGNDFCGGGHVPHAESGRTSHGRLPIRRRSQPDPMDGCRARLSTTLAN